MDMPGGLHIFCACPKCNCSSLFVPDVGIGCCCPEFLGIVLRIPDLDEELMNGTVEPAGRGEAATAMVAAGPGPMRRSSEKLVMTPYGR